MSGSDGWTDEARGLLERAIDRHGGVERWRGLRHIHLPFRRGSGLLLWTKGFGRTFPAPASYEVRPHSQCAIFHGYPDAHHRGQYTAGSVSIVSINDDTEVQRSMDHRRTFAGWRKYRRWSALDALYFFGYALVHYHRLPFSLSDSRLVGVLRRGSAPHGIDVEFPSEVHTHSRCQRFYFGEDGRILRHDYVADVIGRPAIGAHFWEDYERVEGLLIAKRRRVAWRIGHWPSPIVVLDIELGHPEIIF